jgi:isochorismate synthase
MGVSGRFSPLAPGTMQEAQHQFLVQPWDKESPIMAISGEVTADLILLRGMAESLALEPAPDLHPMDEANWATYLHSIQEGIQSGKLRKAVAARFRLANRTRSVFDAFLEAEKKYPDAMVSLVYLPAFGLWLGASPEILIQPHTGAWKTVSMAGTLASASAKWTEKEMEENLATQQFIEEILGQAGASVLEESATETILAGQLEHLVKEYRFGLSEIKIETLVGQLHPTPAVGGLPRSSALSFIQKNEGDTRCLFAGWLGFSHSNQPHLWVNIRCCRLFADAAVLYAGAGINTKSIPADEWEETYAKMNTIGICI